MTDEPIDYLGLGDPAEQGAAQGPALVVPAKMGPRELAVAEQMHRLGASLAANRLLFTVADDVTGVEDWAPKARGDHFDEAERWKAIMRWPRIPTVDEAQAFQHNARVARLAKWWDRLAAARADDERFGYDELGDQPGSKQ